MIVEATLGELSLPFSRDELETRTRGNLEWELTTLKGDP